jgi:hypothetical protein
MGYQEYCTYAKSKGVTITQTQLYLFAEIGLTDEQERLLYEEDIVPDGLDPKTVHTLAVKWNTEHQFDKIPQAVWMQEFMACC